MSNTPKRIMRPLAQMPDTLDTSTPASTAQPVVGAAKGLVQPDGRQEQADRQYKLDKSVENTFFPESEDKDKLGGMTLDRMSLTSLKWMRRADSLIVKGKTPEQLEDVIREVAVYLLAHDTKRTIRERSIIFGGSKEDLEVELDIISHALPIDSSKPLLMAIATRLAEETSTLVVPIQDKDKKSEAAVEGNP